MDSRQFITSDSSDEGFSHVIKGGQLIIQQSLVKLTSSDGVFHVVDVEFAGGNIIGNVATLSDSVAEKAIEGSSCLKDASVEFLICASVMAQLSADRAGEVAKSSVVWSQS